MPMTRQRARSSFTVEIKRSNRRTTEISKLGPPPSPASSSLADQVFRTRPTVPARQDNQGGIPAAVAAPAPESAVRAETIPETPHAQRVLPDLLSTPADPVEERVTREAQERAARRVVRRNARTQQTSREPALPPEPLSHPAETASANAFDATKAIKRGRGRPTRAATIEQAGAPEAGTRKPLKAAAMRAERLGRPLPRLPAGQRWKRRLPKACW
jgi:hypothetical protein